jgi:tetratricopeptide (TPR) repeat protein
MLETGVRAVRLDPDNLGLFYLQGQRLLGEGKACHEGLAYLRIVEYFDPGFEATLFLRGFGAQCTGNFDQAIDAYMAFIALNGSNYTLEYNLGFVLLQKERFDEAITHFKEALDFSPGDKEAHLQLANSYGKIGNTAEQERHLALYQEGGDGPGQ